MADFLGVSDSTYYYMETKDRGSLTLQHLAKMVHELNVNPLFIIKGDLPILLNEKLDDEGNPTQENFAKSEKSKDEDEMTVLKNRLDQLEEIIKSKL